ncbi:MAG: glucose-1-phosphate adenylyltransferase, partial [Deltaproteobacteria bacterium]|nr:glucose-1-phosphate adenylyltransferase [Deltaproteobacteria bacterium]
ASMGIYVFNAAKLYEELERDSEVDTSTHDFGKDFIPHFVETADVRAHRLRDSAIYSRGQTEPYWRDVGTIEAYWSANIDMTSVTPALDLYDSQWPIWTYQLQLPPAKFVFDQDGRRGFAVDSIIGSGSIVSGSTIRSSVIGTEVRINSYCTIEGAVILPSVTISRGARLKRVVIDRACTIPEDLVVGEDPKADAARFCRTEGGVTLITQDMLDLLDARG